MVVTKKFISLLSIILLVVGCGGGSASEEDVDGTTPSPTPAPTPTPAEEKYNIRGEVTLNGNLIIDSDVPNKAFSFLSNNQSSEAQPAFSPVTIIGYAGEHISDEGEYTYDPLDVFVLNVEDTSIDISLYQTNSSADLDIFVYDEADLSSPISFSANLTSFESLSFNGSGIYYLVVDSDMSARGSKYAMVVAESAQESTTNTTMDTGEFLIKTKQDSELTSNNSLKSQNQLRDVFKRIPQGDGIVKVKPDYENIENVLGKSFLKTKISNEFQLDAELVAEIRKVKTLQQLRRKFPGYVIDLNHIYFPDADPEPFSPDPFYDEYQWNLRQINTKEALNLVGQNTKDIVVAVLDSGAPTKDSFAYQNSSFVDDGYDFVSDTDSSFDGDGIDDDPTDPDFQPVQSDGEIFGSHGSHVATTISAKNDGNEINGLAVKTLPLRVCGSDRSENGGGCSSYDQLQAFYYLQGKNNDSGEVYDATTFGDVEIINMSLGGGGNNQIICDEIVNLKNAGIFVVASAGNEGNSAIRFPASCEYAFSVSSTKYDEQLSTFSSFNDYVDIAAPGGQVSEDLDGNDIGDGILAYSFKNSSHDGNDYKGLQVYNGTSMAAPHVSGYFGLIKYLDSDITFDELDLLLKSGQLTKDIGSPGKDDLFGYGLMDMHKGLNLLSTGVDFTSLAYPILSPGKVFMGYALEEKSFEITKVGNGDLEITSVEIQDINDVLTYEASDVDIDGFGTYKALINRTNLSDGSFISLIKFSFSNETYASIPVLYSSGNSKEKETVDQLWICAVNDDDEIIPCDVMQMERGVAAFRIREVPNDTYTQVFACTTLEDNLSFSDSGICGPGDLRGEYQGANFTVSGSDVTGINFSISPVLSN